MGVTVESRGGLKLPPRHVWRSCDSVFRNFITSFFLSLLLTGAALAAPPGAVISNQATLQHLNLAGQTRTLLSNEVSVVTAVVRSPATVSFTRVVGAGTGEYQEVVGPAACEQGGAFVTLADPTIVGGITIDPTTAQEVNSTSSYNIGEAAFIRLEDSDQNLDYQVIDTAVVTVRSATSGDSETIQLSETGLNTGVFAGYVPLGSGAAVSGDCVLQGASSTAIVVDYADPADPTDTATANAQLDPVQRVFESRNGAVVSGSTIALVARTRVFRFMLARFFPPFFDVTLVVSSTVSRRKRSISSSVFT